MSIQIKLKNSVVQDSTPSTSDLPAVGEIALNANINSIGGFMRASDNTIVKIFGPGSLSTPTATTTVSGIAELATSAETTTGSATNRVVTPAGLNAVTVAERSTSNSTYLALAGGTLTGVLAATAGSNSAPSIHFGDSDSGIFGGTNTVSLAAGGTTRLTANTGVDITGNLSVTGTITSTGAVTIPGKIFHVGDVNTAFGFPADDTFSVETGGSEALRVDSSGRLLIGTSSARSPGAIVASFEIEGTDVNTSSLSATRNSADNAGPNFVFNKTRGVAVGADVVVNENDQLGRIKFCGNDGTDSDNTAAAIDVFVDGAPGANDMPGRLVFSTTADGAASPTTRLTIDSAGLSTFTGQIISNGTFTIENTGPALVLKDTDNNSDFQIKNENGQFRVRDTTNSTNRFTIASDGVADITGNLNVGAGLDVTGAITATTSITATGDLLTTGNLNIGSNSSTNPFTKLTFGASQFGSAEIRPTNDASHKVGLSFYTDGTQDATINPTERLRITSAGNVGIGTASPSFKLDVLDTGRFIGTQNSGSKTCLILDNNGTGVTDAAIGFTSGGSSQKASIRAHVLGDGAMMFHNNDDTEKMRIDASGRLGIGTTSPSTKLDVRDSAGTGISSRSTTTQATDSNKGLRVRNNSDTDTFSVSYKGEGYFAGRVGIGESDPAVSIHVKESSPRIHLEDTGTNAIFRINADSSVGNAALDVDINDDTSTPSLIVNIQGNEKMRLTSTGRLGIGTSGPQYRLHQHELSSGANYHHFTNTTTGSTTSDGFIVGINSSEEGVVQVRENTDLRFGTNDIERLRIDNNGKVGIGTATPSATLHVAATGQSNGIRLIDSSISGGAPNLEIISKRSDTNSNTAFAANIFLARHGTSNKCTNANILGSVNFGGNHTDGSIDNISYAASIRGVASNSFDSKSDMPTDLVFCTGVQGRNRDGELAGQSNPGLERVRINSSGTFFLGCTAQPVSGDNGAFFTASSYHVVARNTSSGSAAVFRTFGAAGEFRTTGNGNAKNTNNSYGSTSDQELKENIVDANSQWDDIKALKVRNYNFKESTGYSTHKQIGVIAQELEASGMNGLVVTESDELYTENDTLPEGKNIGDVKEKGYKSVHYSVLYMKGIKALQEAIAKIEILETKVAALEAG